MLKVFVPKGQQGQMQKKTSEVILSNRLIHED